MKFPKAESALHFITNTHRISTNARYLCRNYKWLILSANTARFNKK
jgi:hypothetical protein